LGQRSRKRRREAGAGGDEFVERYRARTQARNDEARARLEPLAPGERPTAVTIGAVVATALGLVNLAFYAFGGEISGDRPALPGVLAYSGLLLAAGYGQWRARYWAVLGMEVLLAIVIVVFSALLVVASNLLAVVVSIAMVGLSGTLFWFLIKAMARIQMPERPR